MKNRLFILDIRMQFLIKEEKYKIVILCDYVFSYEVVGGKYIRPSPSTMYIGYKINFTQERKELNSHLHKCVDKPDHNCYATFVLSFTPTWFIYVAVQ